MGTMPASIVPSPTPSMTSRNVGSATADGAAKYASAASSANDPGSPANPTVARPMLLDAMAADDTRLDVPAGGRPDVARPAARPGGTIAGRRTTRRRITAVRAAIILGFAFGLTTAGYVAAGIIVYDRLSMLGGV